MRNGAYPFLRKKLRTRNDRRDTWTATFRPALPRANH